MHTYQVELYNIGLDFQVLVTFRAKTPGNALAQFFKGYGIKWAIAQGQAFAESLLYKANTLITVTRL